MKLLVLFICLFASLCPSRADGGRDTVRARVSDEVVLKYSFVTSGECNGADFSSEFFMANPTLFFPDSIKSIGGTTEGLRLDRLNDSVYRFSARLWADSATQLCFELYGEALMANTDTGSIYFRKVQLGNKALPAKEYFFAVQGDFGEIPYYRYPKFINIFPSPCVAGSVLSWRIMADQPGRVKFYLVNLVGARDLILETTLGQPGVFDYEYNIQNWQPAGLYYLVMESKFGFTQKKIEIMK